jgi:hypothetical protein
MKKVTVELNIDELNKMVGWAFEIEDRMIRGKGRMAVLKMREITDYLAAMVPDWKQRYAR